jgi:hypothetical protein
LLEKHQAAIISQKAFNLHEITGRDYCNHSTSLLNANLGSQATLLHFEMARNTKYVPPSQRKFYQTKYLHEL